MDIDEATIARASAIDPDAVRAWLVDRGWTEQGARTLQLAARVAQSEGRTIREVLDEVLDEVAAAGADEETGVSGRRYMDDDWELNWNGFGEASERTFGRGHFFRVVSHPMVREEDWGGATWGNSGGIAGCADERERREAIAAKCWAIIDEEPGITLAMVQAALADIDLQLVRTASPTKG